MYPISQLILNLDRMLGIDVKNPEADWLTDWHSLPTPHKREIQASLTDLKSVRAY